jgi:hypothetical protein
MHAGGAQGERGGTIVERCDRRPRQSRTSQGDQEQDPSSRAHFAYVLRTPVRNHVPLIVTHRMHQ